MGAKIKATTAGGQERREGLKGACERKEGDK